MELGNTQDSITNLETDLIHTSSGYSRFRSKSQNSFICEFSDGTYIKYVAPCYNLDYLVKVKRKGKEIVCYTTLESTSEGYLIYQEPHK